MLGCVLSTRGRETIVELWFNYLKDISVKERVLEKMKDLLNIEKSLILYFKDNEKSLKDGSTLKNAELYNVNYNNNNNNFQNFSNKNRKYTYY